LRNRRAARERATQAAEAIAMIEADRDAIGEARALFAKETALRRDLTGERQRLDELERRRRSLGAGASAG